VQVYAGWNGQWVQTKGDKVDWEKFMDDTVENITVLSKEVPQTAKGFNAMGLAAKTPGALDEKTKEIMALGIAIATRCDSCIGFHIKSLIRLGITRAELCEALAMATFMGGGPSYAYSAKALQAFDIFSAD
jgi:AhpD family alkylhydroperoxidase